MENYVHHLEVYTDTLHEEVHVLHHALNPVLVPRAEDPENGVVVGPDEEQYDSEATEDEDPEPMEDVIMEDGDDEDEPDLTDEE